MVVKIGLIIIVLLLKKTTERLGKTSPVRRSRNVTLAPGEKSYPKIVKSWGLFDPITGFGFTVVILGLASGSAKPVKFMLACLPSGLIIFTQSVAAAPGGRNVLILIDSELRYSVWRISYSMPFSSINLAIKFSLNPVPFNRKLISWPRVA